MVTIMPIKRPILQSTEFFAPEQDILYFTSCLRASVPSCLARLWLRLPCARVIRVKSWSLIICLALIGETTWASDGNETIVTYLERYHHLKEDDVTGRLVLADWCAQNQ